MSLNENATLTKLIEHDGHFVRVFKKLDEHDDKFDRVFMKLSEHDDHFVRVFNKLSEHDGQLELVVAKLFEHDDRFERIERNMATKDDLRFISDTLATAMGILERLDQERLSSYERVNRLEIRLERLESQKS